MAWFNMIPDGRTEPRYKFLKDVKVPAETPGDYLLGYFEKILKGADIITYTELKSFCEMTGINLTPGECDLLMDIGSNYNAFRAKAFKIDCPNPVLSEEEIAHKKMISLKAHMKSLRKKKDD